ncbi:MAG: glycosyltransferase family 4 protein [Anaerolineales bacterium]
MRVLFISPWFPYPLQNGSKVRIYHLLRAISKRHEVQLVSFSRQGELVDPTGLWGICDIIEVLPFREFAPHRLRAILGFLSPTPRSIVDVFEQKTSSSINQIIKNQAPDLIICSELATAIYAKEHWKTPIILEDLELDLIRQSKIANQNILLEMRKQINWMKLRRYISSLLKLFKVCTVVSENERQLVRQISPQYEPIHIIPNGVDVEFNQVHGVAPQLNSLIYNGSLTFYPNYDAVLFFMREIFPLIQSCLPQVSLTVTGATQGVDLSRIPYNDHINFTGFLPDIRRTIAKSWACVVPLRLGGGTRIKILEAMALGTPVIATSKAVEGLDVIHGENILIADKPADYAELTIQLLKRPQLRENIARNARRLVEKSYDWKVIGSNFLNVLEQSSQ